MSTSTRYFDFECMFFIIIAILYEIIQMHAKF